MPEMYEVRAKVISQKGRCSVGHHLGDEWSIRGKTPEGICLSAFNSLFPNLRVLMFGGTFSWSDDPDTSQSPAPMPPIR